MKVACGRPQPATAICRNLPQLHQICVESVVEDCVVSVYSIIVCPPMAFLCGSSLQ